MILFFILSTVSGCTNICSNVTNPVVCSMKNSCGKGVPGDFDYYLFSQLYLPAYCDALTRDFDPTVSHDKGARCVHKPQREFGIHGLWPNYIGGFPFCCNKTAEPIDFDDDIRPILLNMTRNWSDPANQTFNDTICGLWNHEWYKHGTCTLNLVAKDFFLTTLQVNDDLQLAMQTITQLLQGGNTVVGSSTIRSLFQTSIQLACDGTVSSGVKSTQLLELRVCFDRTLTTTIDCPPLSNTKTMVACQGKTLTLI